MFKHRNSGGHKAAERIFVSHDRKQSYGANECSITEITWTQHTEHFSHCILSCEAAAPVCWHAGARWLAGVKWSRNALASASDRCLLCSSHSAHCRNETATVWRHRIKQEKKISILTDESTIVSRLFVLTTVFVWEQPLVIRTNRLRFSWTSSNRSRLRQPAWQRHCWTAFTSMVLRRTC